MASRGWESDSGPQIELSQTAAERNGDLWNIAWCVKNPGPQPVRIATARLPHGQFKSEGSRFDPIINLPAIGEACFEIPVRCHEGPGLVTENAFVIFEVIWVGEPWRIFVRLRVVVDREGKPQTKTELITAQRVGFSRSES
jgi:hypothetical protein